MNTIKIIFLDIDGVLNTTETFFKRKEKYINTGILESRIDLVRVKYLKEIIDKTNALIVLTSSYRKHMKKENNIVFPENEIGKELIDILNIYNLKIYDITSIDINIRQKAIIDWLKNNNVESFIILDDESYDLKLLENYLIKTRNDKKEQVGLCEYHINIAINMLNKEKKLILNNK